MAKKDKEPKEDSEKGYKAELDVVIAEYDLTPEVAEGKVLARIMQYNGGEKKLGFVYIGKNGRVRAQNRVPLPAAKLLAKALEQFANDGVL